MCGFIGILNQVSFPLFFLQFILGQISNPLFIFFSHWVFQWSSGSEKLLSYHEMFWKSLLVFSFKILANSHCSATTLKISSCVIKTFFFFFCCCYVYYGRCCFVAVLQYLVLHLIKFYVSCSGLLARSVIQAQAASPTFTHVYAALVAVINTKVRFFVTSLFLWTTVKSCSQLCCQWASKKRWLGEWNRFNHHSIPSYNGALRNDYHCS